MSKYVTYQTGIHAHGDFEVMRESTAELYAAVGFSKRTDEINADIAMFEYDNLIKMIVGIENPAPKLPSYEAWYLARYNRLPS